MLVNLGIGSNCYISRDPVSPGRGSSQWVNSEESGFFLLHRSSRALSMMSLADIHFIHSTIKISKYYFFSISLIFIFHLILWSFRETSPSQMFPSAMNRHLYNSVVYKKYQSKLLREEIRAKWKRINILEKGYKEDERRGTLSCLDF